MSPFTGGLTVIRSISTLALSLSLYIYISIVNIESKISMAESILRILKQISHIYDMAESIKDMAEILYPLWRAIKNHHVLLILDGRRMDEYCVCPNRE